MEHALDPVLLLGKTYCLDGRREEAEKLFAWEFATSPEPEEMALWVALTYESVGESRFAAQWLERAGDPCLLMEAAGAPRGLLDDSERHCV